MTRWIARAVSASDLSAFEQFERSNRPSFEQFNEPHSPSHYHAIGLTKAFKCCLDQHRQGRELTRVVVAEGAAHWLGVGRLKLQATGLRPCAVIFYQTDHRYWRQGVGTALLADLMNQARSLGLTRLEAQITSDNLISLHLLRKAGFGAVCWAAPASLRRGRVECLLLGRTVRAVAPASQSGPHMHQTA